MTSPLSSCSYSQRGTELVDNLRLVLVFPKLFSSGLDRLICFKGSRHYIGPWEMAG